MIAAELALLVLVALRLAPDVLALVQAVVQWPRRGRHWAARHAAGTVRGLRLAP